MSRPPRPFRPSPPALLFPLLLIVLGGVLLLQTTGVLPWNLWGSLWRFWPVLLIALGVQVLLGRRAPWLAAVVIAVLLVGAVGVAVVMAGVWQEETVTTLTEPLAEPTNYWGQARNLGLFLEFGAGRLTVGALPAASPNLVEGRFQGRGARVSHDLSRILSVSGEERWGGRAIRDNRYLRLSMGEGQWPWGQRSTEWALALSQVRSIYLNLKAGAAAVTLDLSELQVSGLNLAVGAANVEVLLPAKAILYPDAIDGHMVYVSSVFIHAGAGNITLVVPPEVDARITSNCVACFFDVDEQRFPRVGDRYESPDLATTKNVVMIDVRGAAAHVTIR